MESANDDSKNGSADQQRNENVCRDFLRNVCTRGKACKYLHPANAEKKMQFCHDFRNSICNRRDCKFIHCSPEDEDYYRENQSLPPSVDAQGNRGSNMRAAPRQDVGLCRDFMNGKCTRGGRCKFRHQSEGDMEYERMRGIRGARGGQGSGGYDDYEQPARRPGPIDAYRAISRYGRPGGYDESNDYLDFETGRRQQQQRTSRALEEENATLRQRVELLRKQVDDLTSTNEVLLQQNAQLRTGKSDMGQMQLAMMSH